MAAVITATAAVDRVTARNTDSWLSAHLHFKGELYGSTCDTVIRDVVGPIVMECDQKLLAATFFFIRYGAEGEHVRLRMKAGLPSSEKQITAIVESVVAASDQSLNLQARWKSYDPEIDRYGGVRSMPDVESAFEASSRMVLAQALSDSLSSRSRRLGVALLAMSVLLFEWLPSRKEAIEESNRYWRGHLRGNLLTKYLRSAAASDIDQEWSRQADALGPSIREVWRVLDEGDALPPAMDRYRRSIREVRDAIIPIANSGQTSAYGSRSACWEQTARFTCPSLVHMTNNRLGVTLAEEAYLAYAFSRATSVP